MSKANVPPTLPATAPADSAESTESAGLFLVKRVIVYQGPGELHDQHVYPQDKQKLTFDHLSGGERALLIKRGIIAATHTPRVKETTANDSSHQDT